MKPASSTNPPKPQNNIKTRFPVFLLTFALLLTGMVLAWFVAHVYHLHDISVWWGVAGAAIFASSIAAWLATIRILSKTRDDLLYDINERKLAERELAADNNLLREIVKGTPDAVFAKDLDGRYLMINSAGAQFSGKKIEDFIGRADDEIYPPEMARRFVEDDQKVLESGETRTFEGTAIASDGSLHTYLVTKSAYRDHQGEIIGLIAISHDITERKRAEEQLVHDAFHDGLTGLANRNLFMDHLQMTIKRHRRGGRLPFAVLFLDFDRFKIINDSLGHTEGDNLLKLVASRLESALRPGDLTARLGGDEFAILLNELEDESAAASVAERIQEELKTPFDLSGRDVFISASIGIALSGGGQDYSAEDMLRDADIAMYRAKAKGKARHQVFDRRMHEHASRQLSLETDIRQALGRGEFVIDYQPIINLENEKPIGFESLIRWKHPTRGMISPAEFIPVAEENNLIIPIGRWILQESCRQMREWQKEYPTASSLSVSVNLSCKQFSQFDLAEQIAGALVATRLDPRCLKLEITESHVMENSEQAILMLNRLRSLGVELSLDDFGTGYSSLSYLHRLPVNNLKIDRSFVMRMAESEENSEIVSTIIKLAQNLKMKVIAEGIETEAQMMRLKHLGCEYGQGYYFSKPLDAKSAAAFINASSGSFSPSVDRSPEKLQLIG